MARRGITPVQVEARARQAAQRMIARGERPGYRVKTADDGRCTVLEAPWLTLERRDAGRATIASWLECALDAFDLET